MVTYSFKKGMTFFLLLCLILCLTGCCEHVWVEATCYTPRTCSECGATQGDVVHTWVEANCTSPETCSRCGVTRGDVVHKWEEATCTTPKTCSECGKTEGFEAPHSFEVIACTEPSVCRNCGKKGEISNHIWLEATCSEPKRCETCGDTEGDALGHSTRYGECSRCRNEVNELAYKEGFAVVTYRDTEWMKDQSDFTDIYVVGTIKKISSTNVMVITDGDKGNWSVDIGTACDLSTYIGTACEVYGFSSGGESSQHKTPLINMSHSDNRVIFIDGKELYPEDFDSTQQFSNKFVTGTTSDDNIGVWIPTDGGTKYHSDPGCSSMYNPCKVPLNEALALGYESCKKCH